MAIANTEIRFFLLLEYIAQHWKGSRRKKRAILLNKLRILVATYELYRFARIERDGKGRGTVGGDDKHDLF